MEKKAKIFVAGASGFLGKAIVKALKNHGYSQLLTPSRQELDLENSSQVESFFKNEDVEYVFLCAGYVGGIKKNQRFPANFIQKNLSIYLNTVQSSIKHGTKKLLFVGSSCMYPVNAALPFVESDLFSGPLEPTNHSFAVSKLAGYELCRSYNQQEKKPFITAIPTGLYGMNDHFDLEAGHVIPSLFTKFWQAKNKNEKFVKVWGSGKQTREFLFVDDCAAALVRIMDSYNDPEAINIGMGEKISIKDLAFLMKDICGFKGDIEFDTNQPEGMREKSVSATKLESLSWQPTVSLQEGLKITWEWAQQNVF